MALPDLVAIHEAAHGVVALLRGLDIEELALGPVMVRTELADGACKGTGGTAEDCIVTIVAARVAEGLAVGGLVGYDSSDWEEARLLAEEIDSAHVGSTIAKAETTAEQLLEQNWDLVLWVAKQLNTRHTLDGETLRGLVDDYLAGRRGLGAS